MKRWIPFFVLLSLLLAACDNNDDSNSSDNSDYQKTIQFLSDQGLSDQGLIDCIFNQYPNFTANMAGVINNLSCDGNIQDLKGIGVFHNLESLQLFNTHIKDVDTNNLSFLNQLSITNDDSTVSISVNQLGSLKSLHLNNLPLTSLDMSKFQYLNLLSLQSMHMDSLALISPVAPYSALGASLEKVYIQDSSFASLSISELHALNTIMVFNTTISNLLLQDTRPRLFAFGDTQIDSLALNKIQFAPTIHFANCGITTVTLSDIRHVGAISLANNNIQTIDLSGVSLIDQIDLTGNPLSPETIAYLNGITDLQIGY